MSASSSSILDNLTSEVTCKKCSQSCKHCLKAPVKLQVNFCILDFNPPSDTQFADMFSHSIGYLFILLLVFFAMQQHFSFMSSHLCLLLFPVILVSHPKDCCQDQYEPTVPHLNMYPKELSQNHDAFALPCSLQHYLQQPRQKSSLYFGR